MADVVDPRLQPRDVVMLYIGEDRFIVDRFLLEGRGTMFSEVYETHSKKNHIIEIFLPKSAEYIDQKDLAIEDYVEYVRSGTFAPAIPNKEAKYAPHYDQIDRLLDLYLYATQIKDQKAQDDTMDCLLATYKEGDNGQLWLPDLDIISRVYSVGAPGKKLRKFLVDVHIWAGKVGEKKDCDHYGFLKELKTSIIDQIMALDRSIGDLYSQAKWMMDGLNEKKENRGMLVKGIPKEVKCCDYHKHGAGDECGNKKRKRPVEFLDD